jgi:protein-S-isoprenylcysteine O-methyltransferase Ste14
VTDRLRYLLAVTAIVCYPPGLFFWFLIHPFAAKWRTIGPLATYSVVMPVLAICGYALFRMRALVIGTDYGTNWTLTAISAIFFAAMFRLEIAYRPHLSASTLVGVPELTASAGGRVIREGVYGVIRHPRYLSAVLGGIGWALVTNYSGGYVVAVIAFPVLYIVTLLEERELVARFGDAYRVYQRDVPRFVPRAKHRAGEQSSPY